MTVQRGPSTILPGTRKEGERIDGILAWNGANIWPGYGQSRVTVHQASNGRDLSDHYGLTTSVSGYQELKVAINKTVKKVTVALHSFHCLEETNELGSDEVYFYLKGKSHRGQQLSGKSGVRTGVDSGEFHTVSRPVTNVFTNPGHFLDISVKGMEDDWWGDDWMGTTSIRLTREEMQELINRTVFRVMPRLTKDGGEYAVTISIQAE